MTTVYSTSQKLLQLVPLLNSLNTTYTDLVPADTTDPETADTTDPAPADTSDLPAAPTHAELKASFDVTRRDIQDPPEILEESVQLSLLHVFKVHHTFYPRYFANVKKLKIHI